MVEGPGCRVKAERLRPRVVGQEVKQVKGTTVQNKEKSRKDGEASFYSLVGKKIRNIRTLGKEFFIFFEDFDMCLRVHWLMSGSFRLNQESLDNDWGQSADMANSMHLVLSKDEVVFRKSAYHLRNAQESLDKIAAMVDLDICSETFNSGKATEMVSGQGDRIVSDVLLDQAILPGVGNIIKNEALFDSSINPKKKICELSQAHISHLVNMTRDFSMVFYKCRRDGKSLHPHLKIYRKGVCKQCNNKTITTKLGDDSARLTTYCTQCQDNTLRLPTKNSLLGWVSRTDDQVEWACVQCTYVNAAIRSNCAICLIVKGGKNQHDQTMEDKSEIQEKKRLKTRACNQREGGPTKVTRISQVKSSLKEKCPDAVITSQTIQPQEDVIKKKRKLSNVPPLLAFHPLPENCMPANQHAHSSPHDRNETGSQKNTSHSTNLSTANSIDKCTGATVSTNVLGPPPVCSGHRRKCIFRTVHKAGPNKGRVFWSCAQNQGKSCGTFLWADEKFPRCPGHDRIAVLRTVYKEGANNGRKFLACPLGKQKQCEFFEWVDA